MGNRVSEDGAATPFVGIVFSYVCHLAMSIARFAERITFRSKALSSARELIPEDSFRGRDESCAPSENRYSSSAIFCLQENAENRLSIPTMPVARLE